jgi:hypothetical protein
MYSKVGLARKLSPRTARDLDLAYLSETFVPVPKCKLSATTWIDPNGLPKRLVMVRQRSLDGCQSVSISEARSTGHTDQVTQRSR